MSTAVKLFFLRTSARVMSGSICEHPRTSSSTSKSNQIKGTSKARQPHKPPLNALSLYAVGSCASERRCRCCSWCVSYTVNTLVQAHEAVYTMLVKLPACQRLLCARCVQDEHAYLRNCLSIVFAFARIRRSEGGEIALEVASPCGQFCNGFCIVDFSLAYADGSKSLDDIIAHESERCSTVDSASVAAYADDNDFVLLVSTFLDNEGRCTKI